MGAVIHTKRKIHEVLNTISHAIGIPLSIAGLVLLVVFGAMDGTVWHVVSYSIFGSTLIMVYSASTIFHGTSRLRTKYWLNKIDHSSIYLLIAGSYTPICLVSLRGPWGWVLFGIIWALAIFGIVFKFTFYNNHWRLLSTALYVLMGWLILIAIVPVLKHVPNTSLWFLLAGGLSYSVGVVFYSIRKLPVFHFIFHLFVLAGSILHFFAFLYMINS